MEKDRGQGYVAGLEQILKSSHLYLKDTIANFQEKCQMVAPEKNVSYEIIVDIRKHYTGIQDQLIKIKGIQQLLEGKYRQYYRRNTLRDREIIEFGVLVKKYYLKFEYMLKEVEAKGRLREQERPLQEYDQMVSIPWFHSEENQVLLLRNLRSLNDLDYKIPSGLKVAEKRQVIQSGPRSLSLFVLSGEVNLIDDLQSRIRLREYDITERYSRDEFRGALTHLKEISVAEVEKVIRRFTQSGEFSKFKYLLFSIQSSKDLRSDVLGSTETIIQRMAAGEVKIFSI